MKIAVEGCAHGELDKIYEAIQALENRHGIKIDLLIICGDFQAVRNPSDLESMAVPPKYRKLNTFYKYYSGEKTAPVLTIFIGGNHEASNYLSELSYGGWVCPNIFYMGYANVINIGGLRIAGLSGIYKGHDYLKGHFETPPYDKSTVKSVYHVRNVDVFRLKQIKRPIDICISHDWPRSVYKHGDMEQLLRFKPFFRQEMESNKLGSQPSEELLNKLKPSYWFAAHLHCKFSALVPHDDSDRPFTKFLALDKCLPKRRFLQVLEIGEPMESPHLEYDPEWLCVLQQTNHLLNVTRCNSYMPGESYVPTNEEIDGMRSIFNGDLKVPDNFAVTAPKFFNHLSTPSNGSIKKYLNPQTQAFCKLLNLADPQTAVSSSESFTISDFLGTETEVDTSMTSEIDSSCNTTPKACDPDEVSCSDEETEEYSITDAGQEFLGFFIDTVGTRNGKKLKRSSVEPGISKNLIKDMEKESFPKNNENSFESNKQFSSNRDNSFGMPANKTVSESFPMKTEKSENLFGSKNVQNFLDSEPDGSEIPVRQTELESFPEIKTEDVVSEGTSSEQKSQSFIFKRRNQSLYVSCESSEISENNAIDDSVVKRFKRRNFPACHNVE